VEKSGKPENKVWLAFSFVGLQCRWLMIDPPVIPNLFATQITIPNDIGHITLSLVSPLEFLGFLPRISLNLNNILKKTQVICRSCSIFRGSLLLTE
jgi:hypothetical protein